jgi:FdhE protein
METESRILQKLAEWERQQDPPADVARFYRDIFSLQYAAKRHIEGHAMAEEEVSEHLKQGIALQSFDELPFAWPVLKYLLQQVVAIIGRQPSTIPADISRLNDIFSDDNALEHIVETWYNSGLISAKTDLQLLAIVIQAGMWPFLNVQAEILSPQIEQSKWRRRYCPVCGGKPDFAFLAGENGARWLSCSRCDAEWLFQRLECPYCGTQDQSKLAYFTDEKEVYRLYVCEQCRSYIKSIDLRKTDNSTPLRLQKIFTTEMDVQAQQDGFVPGWARKRNYEKRRLTDYAKSKST